MYPDSPLFIYSYNIISKIPRSHLDPLPEFFQCGKQSKLGSIYEISLTKLSLHCANYFRKVPHYQNEILTNLRGEYIVSRVLIEDTISKFSQYGSNMEKLMVYPKHSTLSNNANKSKGILGLDSIENPFKVNVSLIQDTIEIGSVASVQSR